MRSNRQLPHAQALFRRVDGERAFTLLVSKTLTLEEVYGLLAGAEDILGRRINPTLYTTEEFQLRVRNGNPFVTRMLAGDTIVLMGKLPDE